LNVNEMSRRVVIGVYRRASRFQIAGQISIGRAVLNNPAGTAGGISSPIPERAQVVSVKTFGAVGDGVTNDTAKDSPRIEVPVRIGEMQRAFIATMYLRWIPAADSACTAGAACTIQVPLGSANWKWSGCAINAQQIDPLLTDNGTHLIKSCSSDPQVLQAVSFQHTTPSSGNHFGYVGWSNTWSGSRCTF
jgi:hypothetical protein